MKLHALAALFVVACPSSVFAVAAELPLVEAGQPRAVVVLSAALKPQDFSAKTLISHVQQMSGATLPTIKESELAGSKVENGRLIPAGKILAETFILLVESDLTKRLGLSLDG